MITYSGRKKNNEHILVKEREDIRRNFSTLLTAKDWSKLCRQGVQSPSLEAFKINCKHL